MIKSIAFRKWCFIAIASLLTLLYAAYTNVFSYQLFIHIWISIGRMFLGYMLAVILGTVFALLLSVHRYGRMAFKPLLSFFMSIPTITWVPVLLIITGISDQTIITAIFLGAFFAITYNTMEGIDTIPENWIKVGRMLGWNRWQILVKISIPGALNAMLLGLKLGISYAWRALVGAEMLGASQHGLGFLLFASRKYYQIHQMLVILLLLGILGSIMDRLIIGSLENRTVKKWGIQ